MPIFGIFRNTIVLGWLVVGLLLISMSLGLRALHLTATVATMTATAASTAIKHRKDMARAIAKVKAKARLRRMLVAFPLIGLPVAATFELRDYEEWQAENPGKDFNDYACEVSSLSAEVMDEVLQELPDYLRPSPSTMSELVPECSEDEWIPT
jgi:hypothetical protein